METWRPWSYPTPLCTTGRLEKKSPTGVEKERVKVRKIENRELKEAGSEWESKRWRWGREGWAKMSERREEKESEWVGCREGGWGLEALDGWSWLGARVLVWKQAEQCVTAKPEIQLCRKRAPFAPQKSALSSLSPPCASITPSITHSTLPPDRLSYTQQHFQTDQMGSVKYTPLSAVIYITVTLPLSWAALFPSAVLPKQLQQNQLSTPSL